MPSLLELATRDVDVFHIGATYEDEYHGGGLEELQWVLSPPPPDHVASAPPVPSTVPLTFIGLLIVSRRSSLHL